MSLCSPSLPPSRYSSSWGDFSPRIGRLCRDHSRVSAAPCSLQPSCSRYPVGRRGQGATVTNANQAYPSPRVGGGKGSFNRRSLFLEQKNKPNDMDCPRISGRDVCSATATPLPSFARFSSTEEQSRSRGWGEAPTRETPTNGTTSAPGNDDVFTAAVVTWISISTRSPGAVCGTPSTDCAIPTASCSRLLSSTPAPPWLSNSLCSPPSPARDADAAWWDGPHPSPSRYAAIQSTILAAPECSPRGLSSASAATAARKPLPTPGECGLDFFPGHGCNLRPKHCKAHGQPGSHVAPQQHRFRKFRWWHLCCATSVGCPGGESSWKFRFYGLEGRGGARGDKPAFVGARVRRPKERGEETPRPAGCSRGEAQVGLP